MRVLLVNHLPLEGSAAGAATSTLADALMALGHQVQVLVVDDHAAGGVAYPVHRVVCRPNDPQADLPFAIPRFSGPADNCTFASLSDEQLDLYRNVLRGALDEVMAAHHPDIVHCHFIWLAGHLALESGAPYVLTVDGEELPLAANDPRYARLAREAAENAGRVIAPTRALETRTHDAFGDLEGRIRFLSEQPDTGRWAEQTVEIYNAVLDDRLGPDRQR